MINAIVNAAVRGRLFILLALAGVLFACALLIPKLNLDAFPDVTNVQVVVNTQAPGLAAEEVEQLITYPVESVMYALPDIAEVRSVSKVGLSVVTVVFKEGTDLYLARQLVFERLQAAREDFDKTRELRQADNAAIGIIGDMSLADEGHHVVFAMGFDIDVAEHDDVVIALHVVEGAGEVFARVFAIALEPFAIGVDDAAGGVDQAFALGVVAGPGDEGADSIFRLIAGGALGKLVGGLGQVLLGLILRHGVHGPSLSLLGLETTTVSEPLGAKTPCLEAFPGPHCPDGTCVTHRRLTAKRQLLQSQTLIEYS